MDGVSTAVRRRITVLNYLVGLLSGLGNGWIGPFLPQIAGARGLALDRAGLMVSAMFVGFLVAVLAAGQLVERWGGRIGLTLAAGWIGAGFLGVAIAPTLPTLLGAAALVGLGSGTLDIAGHVTIAALNPQRTAAALNYLNVFFGVGAFLGPLIVGLMLRGGIPYGVAYSSGALIAALIAVLLFTTPLPHARAVAMPGAGEGSILARPVLWMLGVVLILYIGLEAGVATWLFPFQRSVGGLEEAAASWSVSLFWIGLVAGRTLGGGLAGRVAVRPQTLGAAALAATALLLLAQGPAWPPLQLATIVVIGMGCGPIFANAITTGIALFPRQVSAMTVAIIAVGSLGGIAGPWVMGRALVLAGPRAAMTIAGVAALLLLGAYWLVGRFDAASQPQSAGASARRQSAERA